MSASDRLPNPPSSDTGELLAEYETGSGQHWLILIGAPILAAFFIGAWIYALATWEGAMAGAGFIAFNLILLGIGGFFVVGFVVGLLAWRWRLSIFENGMLYRGKWSSRWVPWRDVALYYERHVILNGVPMGHNMSLRLKGGKKFAIDQFLKDTASVCQHIKGLLLPVLVSRAEEELARGEAVDFLHVKVRKDGLETPKGALAWTDVESVAVEDNKGIDYHLVVRAIGEKKPWLDVPVITFPSMEVFLWLVEKATRRSAK